MDASRGFVLVIDEDERIRETTARWFEDQGYRVAAANGETGVQIARRDHPDVILLDAEMPSRRGYETLEQLKFDSTTREVPVIVFNGNQRALNWENLREIGDFVSRAVSLQARARRPMPA